MALPRPLPRHEEFEEPDDGRMPFLEHLDELRKRIIWALVSVAGGVLIVAFFIQRLFDFVMRPLTAVLPPGGRLIYTEPTEAFVLYFKIAVLGGIVVAMPAVMLQVWWFVAPGLRRTERRLVIPFLVLTSLGFAGGAAFSHYVAFPVLWVYLASFSTDYLVFMPRVADVFALYVKMLLGMGLVFQMPSVVFFLARLGVVTAGWLVRHAKYAVLANFIVAALLTPSGDPVNQALIGIPMCVLYAISIGIAWVFQRRRS